jgi:hypothetical protein
MPEPRRVFLDPDGTLPGLLGVVIAYPTGVRYEHQCAGTETVMRSVEGYFVPLGGPSTVPAQLTEVFHKGSACVWGGTPQGLPPNTPDLPPDRLERLRALVEAIPYSTQSDADSNERGPLRLDDSRLGELVEGWVPVLTPDGPGILVWENCD